jgi:membrane protein
MKAGVIRLARDTFRDWRNEEVFRLGAAVSFYTVLSLVPLFILSMTVVSRFFGQRTATDQALHGIQATLGVPLGDVLARMLNEAPNPVARSMATVLGLITLLFASFRTFGELEAALNIIDHVKKKAKPGLWPVLRKRFLSLQVILGGLLFLVVSMLGPLMFAILTTSITEHLWGGPLLWQAAHAVLAFAFLWLLFVLIYKLMPDATIAWRDVAVGAALAALLFTGGKYLLSFYLSRKSITTGYGVAWSMMVLLLWVYYACQSLLFGAVFTRVYAEHYGQGIQPAQDAKRLS